jgi:murein L,D-transpeptidase YcbB/YkuD
MNYVLLIIVFYSFGCSPNYDKKIKKDKPGIINFNDSIPPIYVAGNFSDTNANVFDSSIIKQFFDSNPALNIIKNYVEKFYSIRRYSCAWLSNGKISEQANILFNRIIYINDHDIFYDAPYLEDYKRIMTQNEYDSSFTNELMISAQYFYFAKVALSGVNESESKSTSWYIPRKKIDYVNLLNQLIINNEDHLNSTLYPQYYKLLENVEKYSTIEKQNEWVKLTFPKTKFIIGDTGEIIQKIRTNLFIAGDLPINNQSNLFDDELKKAIQSFQERFGINNDGSIGRKFIEEMNVPIRERIETILINIERCKWIPNETESEHIIVNIPEFKLTAFNKEEIVFKCNVVVGKSTNKTIIFKGDMKYIVFSPYWNVPESIIKKEILPKMKNNESYLERNNMEWNDGKIRQRPGEGNSLGLVKFVFPNNYNIYLHDTPAKSLFNEERRTFSHGCIRISEPIKMIKFLLQGDTIWNDQKIYQAMHSGKERHLKLAKNIPVYIVYFTSFVDEKGKLNFRKDVYDRDDNLKKMIFKQ